MNKEQIKKIVTEVIQNSPNQSNIKSIALFGSFLHGDQTIDSDVDLLVDLKESTGFFKLMEIQNMIEDGIGRPVQLLTKNSISRYFRTEVLREAEKIYE